MYPGRSEQQMVRIVDAVYRVMAISSMLDSNRQVLETAIAKLEYEARRNDWPKHVEEYYRSAINLLRVEMSRLR